MTESQIPSKYGYWARSAFDSARRTEYQSKQHWITALAAIHLMELAARYDIASWYFLFLDEFYKTEHEA